MDHNIATKVAHWLWSKTKVKEAQPVVVQIGHHTYVAARYVEAQKGGNHQTRLFCLGTLPPLHSKMRRLCYQTDPDSEQGWHLLAWFRQNRPCPEWEQVHPFGSHFVLALLTPLEIWAQEQFLQKPYRRILMTFVEVGPPISRVKEKYDDRS
jgi:hypothetical protein